MGYGLFFANSSKDGQSNTHLSPRFNLIAGARYALSPQWAFFGDSSSTALRLGLVMSEGITTANFLSSGRCGILISEPILIDYNGGLHAHSLLLAIVLHD